jgi:thymidylate synthase
MIELIISLVDIQYIVPEVYITELYSNTFKNQKVLSLNECIQLALNNTKFSLLAEPDVYTILIQNFKNLIDNIDIFGYTEDNPTVKSLLDNNWVILDTNKYHTILIYRENGEYQYLKLLSDLNSSMERTGRNGLTKSIFAPQILKFNLLNGYPLLTTKKMFFRGIVEELLFFIRGDTNSKILEFNNINIWKQNTSRHFLDSLNMHNRKEGMMGPMYGFQWRHFNGTYDEITGKGIGGVDQLQNLITSIKTDPHSRRHLLTDYNPEMANQGVLYPCHSISIQFYVQDEFLDLICFNRSSDVFLGLSFNIASTSLLLIIIAKITGLVPRYVNISLGDAHIYEQHITHIEKQTNRRPFEFPKIEIKKEITTLNDAENLSFEDFELKNYRHYPAIIANMIP